MDGDLLWRMILLSMAGLIMGASLVISIRYFNSWRKHRGEWKGLLPLHVFVVTLSYNLMMVYSTVETFIRIEDDSDVPLWRALLLGPAYALGLVAMWSIYSLRKKRELME